MLTKVEPEKIIKSIPGLHDTGKTVSRGIHSWVLRGATRRKVADWLHGSWLGHPLHPLLTDVTIGAWLFSYALDLIGMVKPSKGLERAADTLLGIGNASAVGTAAAGIADFSTIPRKSMATGTLHGSLNMLGFVVNLLSAYLRKRRQRKAGFVLSSISSTILFVSAWLGGELAYKYRVGVNRIPNPPEGEKWHPTINEFDLPEQTPRRVEVEGLPVLLYRYKETIYAIGAVCAHEGAPLDEGEFDGTCVTCPWHQSVYDLRDGSVVHGPTTYASPAFNVRVINGRIELQRSEQPIRRQVETQAEGVMVY